MVVRRKKATPVILPRDRSNRQPWFRSPHLVPLVCIAAAVLVANGPSLLHLVTTNPLVLDAGLTPRAPGRLPGLPYVDGNAGFTMQALGHRAALDWLHGHVPWWNPYEGVGSPLAGEMQSGAFFPLTLVLAVPQGSLVLQLVVEAVTGWSTYFLVRRLGVGRTLATAAGVAFALSGTFAWLAHAPIRPVALLPLCLLGVERAIEAARERRPGGWRLLAVALALSVLAGFPETSLIDGVFVAWWAALRLAGPGRAVWRSSLARLAGGVVGGAALAAPLLVAFADYLPYGYVGAHNGAVAHASLPTVGLTQLLLPYSLGPVFGFHLPTGVPDTVTGTWAYVGGFLSATMVAAALVGVVGRRLRSLRLGLAGWIAVCLLRTFGFQPVVHLLASVPGIRLTAFYRYADPSWELAVVVLAGLGLDDLARRATRPRVLVAAAFVTAAAGAWAAVTAWPLMTEAVATPPGPGGHRYLYPLANAAGAALALALLVVGGVLAAGRARAAPRTSRSARLRRRGRIMMAVVVGAESVLLFGVTSLSAPPPTALRTGSVAWLQHHLGAYRFLTLGPIQPNYGSYFDIAQANVNDLPVPKAWNTEIATQLDPNALPAVFTGGGRIRPTGPTAAQELSAHLAQYESVGVRYIVENADGRDVQGQPFPPPGSPPWPTGPRLVHRDGFAQIWELPSSAPVFSLRSLPSRPPGSRPSSSDRHGGLPRSCVVTGSGWDQATVRCSRPSLLIRRVQFVPGWSAVSPSGSRVVVKDTSGPPGLFQEVVVPAGTTTVHFRFLPPHELPAAIVFLVALLALVLPVLVRRARGIPGPDPARTGSGRGPAGDTVPDGAGDQGVRGSGAGGHGAGGHGAGGHGAGGHGATGAAPVGDSPSD
jgi:hypothetical protein